MPSAEMESLKGRLQLASYGLWLGIGGAVLLGYVLLHVGEARLLYWGVYTAVLVGLSLTLYRPSAEEELFTTSKPPDAVLEEFTERPPPVELALANGDVVADKEQVVEVSEKGLRSRTRWEWEIREVEDDSVTALVYQGQGRRVTCLVTVDGAGAGADEDGEDGRDVEDGAGDEDDTLADDDRTTVRITYTHHRRYSVFQLLVRRALRSYRLRAYELEGYEVERAAVVGF